MGKVYLKYHTYQLWNNKC